MTSHEAIIIGSGPAGMFAARELGLSGIDALLLERGKATPHRICPMTVECYRCSSCHEIEGVGGAGGYSDGKLCNGAVGIKQDVIGTDYANEVLYVNQVFKSVLGDRYRVSTDKEYSCTYDQSSEEVTEVVNLGSGNIRFFFEKSFHCISSPKRIDAKVIDVRPLNQGFEVEVAGGHLYTAKYVLIATGKCDFLVRPRVMSTFQLRTNHHFPTFGVRLEVPSTQIQALVEKGNNPKLKRYYGNGEYVKTHCFCYGGEVMAYVCGPYFLVGGRSDTVPTKYANVNILYRSNSPETTRTIFDCLDSFSQRYPHNVMGQGISSFMHGTRDNELRVSPCRGEILGDLASLYPEKILAAIRDFISHLINSQNLDITGGLVHGPSAEWIAPDIAVASDGETSTPNLFFTGDSSGKTQGVIAAAVMGIRAARTILARQHCG